MWVPVTADFAGRKRVVRVVAALSRKIEGDEKPVWPDRGAPVPARRFFRRSYPAYIPITPELTPIHRRRDTGVRDRCGVAQIGLGVAPWGGQSSRV